MGLSRTYNHKDITWHQIGPCIIPGHLAEHILEVECLSAMRRWMFPNKTWAEYLRAVELKRRR